MSVRISRYALLLVDGAHAVIFEKHEARASERPSTRPSDVRNHDTALPCRRTCSPRHPAPLIRQQTPFPAFSALTRPTRPIDRGLHASGWTSRPRNVRDFLMQRPLFDAFSPAFEGAVRRSVLLLIGWPMRAWRPLSMSDLCAAWGRRRGGEGERGSVF